MKESELDLGVRVSWYSKRYSKTRKGVIYKIIKKWTYVEDKENPGHGKLEPITKVLICPDERGFTNLSMKPDNLTHLVY